jgi:hypothetical protein
MIGFKGDLTVRADCASGGRRRPPTSPSRLETLAVLAIIAISLATVLIEYAPALLGLIAVLAKGTPL